MDENDADYAAGINTAKVIARLSRYYRLLVWVFAVFMISGFLFIIFSRPLGFVEYTANATIGPTDADTGSNLVSAISGVSGLAGALSGKSILSSLSGAMGSNDFDEYTQVLTSTRLARILAQKDGVLPVIFPAKWDAKNRKWYSRDDSFHRTVDFVKGLLNIPVKPHPDVDDLVDFLEHNLNVDTSYTSSFVNVSFSFSSPEEATRILSLILSEADEVIRQDKRRDVSARMKYLEQQLPTLSDVSERESAISVLSTQQQMMVMIEADKSYAATILDMPHASLSPTAPSIAMIAMLVIVFSFCTWCLMIFSLREDNRFLVRFNRLPWQLPAGQRGQKRDTGIRGLSGDSL